MIICIQVIPVSHLATTYSPQFTERVQWGLNTGEWASKCTWGNLTQGEPKRYCRCINSIFSFVYWDSWGNETYWKKWYVQVYSTSTALSIINKPISSLYIPIQAYTTLSTFKVPPFQKTQVFMIHNLRRFFSLQNNLDVETGA